MPFSYTKKGVGERLDNYPFVHAMALGLAVSATDLVVKVGFSPQGQWLVMLLAVFAVFSGTAMIIGLQWRGTAYMAYGIERFGHIMATGAWLIDIYVLLTLAGFSLGLFVPMIFIAAHTIRSKRLGRLQRELKSLLAQTVKAGAAE